MYKRVIINMWAGYNIPAHNLPHNQIKYFLCKCDHNPAGKGKEAVGSLRGIVGLKRKSDLHNTPAEDNNTDRTDNTEDKSG